MKTFTDEELDQLAMSDEYAEYIMDNCHGDRIICNGDTSIRAIEDGYLFDSFVDSVSCTLPNK
jgi:S-adenosylmethionine:tRNA-ribosyltransferase-isomerase (queuine synthetase)